jgi:hypothetical protein
MITSIKFPTKKEFLMKIGLRMHTYRVLYCVMMLFIAQYALTDDHCTWPDCSGCPTYCSRQSCESTPKAWQCSGSFANCGGDQSCTATIAEPIQPELCIR